MPTTALRRAKAETGAKNAHYLIQRDKHMALILPDGSNARATLNAAHRLLWPRKFPIDLVAITATVWAEKSTLLAREIEVQGIVLYERGTD